MPFRKLTQGRVRGSKDGFIDCIKIWCETFEAKIACLSGCEWLL